MELKRNQSVHKAWSAPRVVVVTLADARNETGTAAYDYSYGYANGASS